MAINNTLFQKAFDGDCQSQYALCSQILLITATFVANPDKPQDVCLLKQDVWFYISVCELYMDHNYLSCTL